MDLPQISIQYVSLYIPKLVATILNAVKLKTLNKVFLIPAYPEQEPQIILSYGDRMNDKEYQKLVECILQTDGSAEKIKFILNEVHSLADMLDRESEQLLFAALQKRKRRLSSEERQRVEQALNALQRQEM